jgi:predicted transcriptional regulator
MFEPIASRFLTPSKALRRLSILSSICNDSKISQHKIGTAANLSSSMVNNYIKEFLANELITISGNTNRSQQYHLTDKGRKELKAFLDSYSAEINGIYENAQESIKKIVELSDSLTPEPLTKHAEYTEISNG